MLPKEFNKKKELYIKSLKNIMDLKFTMREIDVVACIIHNCREKKIACLLFISHRTVSVHTRNIMYKMGCRSKECIVNNINQSGKLAEFAQYYYYILVESTIIQTLYKLKKINIERRAYTISYKNLNPLEEEILKQISSYLQLADLQLIVKKGELDHDFHILNNHTPMAKTSNNNSCAILLDQNFNKEHLSPGQIYIDFSIYTYFYQSLYQVLKKIAGGTDLEIIIKTLKDQYRVLYNSMNNKINFESKFIPPKGSTSWIWPCLVLMSLLWNLTR